MLLTSYSNKRDSQPLPLLHGPPITQLRVKSIAFIAAIPNTDWCCTICMGNVTIQVYNAV